MRILLLPAALALSTFTHLTNALLTFGSIRNLTDLTDECRSRILNFGSVGTVGDVEIDPMVRVLGGEQRVLGAGRGDRGDGGEVEDVSFVSVLCVR